MICSVFFSSFTAFFFHRVTGCSATSCALPPQPGHVPGLLCHPKGTEKFLVRKPPTHLCPPLLACTASAGSRAVLGLLALLQEDIWQHLECLSGKFGQFLLSA